MRKNRAYKKGSPFRDARLFVIACEGEKREKEYFELLGRGSQRLKVKVLGPERGNSKSAPKWVIDRLVNFIDQEGVNIETGDIVWIVIDVDGWLEKQLYQIAKICKEQQWKFALSNPCFEVWLWMHFAPIDASTGSTCKDLKQEINDRIIGGYKVEEFIKNVEFAQQQALVCRDDHKQPIPPFKISRVYLLVQELLEMF